MVDQIDVVMCTHLHVDHVARNTRLDNVRPVVEAGLAHMGSGTYQVDEHISVDPAPGHTPGTVAITLVSRGDRAFFSGDILHHAIQVYEPTWNSFACADGVSARTSRRKVLEECAGTGGALMPAHFGVPFACHVDAERDRFVHASRKALGALPLRSRGEASDDTLAMRAGWRPMKDRDDAEWLGRFPE